MSDDHIGVKIDGVIYVKLDDVKPMRAYIEELGAANDKLSCDTLQLYDRIEKLEAGEIEFDRIIGEYASENARFRDRIEKLEAALRNIAEGDIPRTVKAQFRDDGEPSKNDRCEHGQWMYEECGCCIEDYARKVLEGKDE